MFVRGVCSAEGDAAGGVQEPGQGEPAGGPALRGGGRRDDRRGQDAAAVCHGETGRGAGGGQGRR